MQKILVVDDHQDTAEFVSALVEGFGFSPVTCTGEYAFKEGMAQALKPGNFSAMILDWDLPGGNGGEIITAALANGFLPANILVISGKESNLELARALGVVKTLLKPSLFNGVKSFILVFPR